MIFFGKPCDKSGEAPGERQAWRRIVYALVAALTTPRPQGMLTVDRMCALAGVSGTGYYRHWQASAQRHEEIKRLQPLVFHQNLRFVARL